MRDTEIAVLGEQIEALSQEKRRLSRGFFRKKSTENLDKEVSELCLKKQPLVAVKQSEEEEKYRKIEYENENDRLKERVERFKTESEAVLAENAKLKKYVEEMEGERERLDAKEAQFQEKIAELKQIIQTHLEQGHAEQENGVEEGKSEIERQKVKKKVGISRKYLYCSNTRFQTHRDGSLFLHSSWGITKVIH